MKIWVIGAGAFGTRAVGRLLLKNPKVRLLVADPDPRALEGLGLGVKVHHGDGIAFLDEYLKTPAATDGPDWIVPAAPKHVAFLWIVRRLSRERGIKSVPVPKALESVAPFTARGPQGCLYLSMADFLCPEDCPEPAGQCTKTGVRRKINLFEALESPDVPGWAFVVVRSHQLAPGVGGFKPSDLFAAHGALLARPGLPAVVSTACRCHGVADGLVIDSLGA